MAWIWALGAPAATAVALAVGGLFVAVPVYHAICLAALALRRPRLGAASGRWIAISTALVLGGLGLALLLPRPGDAGTILRERVFGGSGTRFWIFAAYSMLVHCWAEELFWRGVVDPGSAAANAAGFYLQHAIPIGIFLGSPGLGALLSIPAGAAGLYWSWVSRRTGSLWPALASHAAADLMILAIVRSLAFP